MRGATLSAATIGLDVAGARFTRDEAFRFCDRMARAHYENFPVGSLLVPARLRPYVHAVYAFARVADDVADEAQYAGHRLRLLDEWDTLLRRAYEGQAEHPVFVALRETAERFDIPIGLFRDLLTAFRMDVTVTRYATWDDVLHYCRHSANPIGRLVLYLFGYRDAETPRLSDSICTALQLTNFWQDVSIDLAKDRVYIPIEEMDRVGYRLDDLLARRYTPAFVEVMRACCARTQALFDAGLPLCERVERRLAVEMRFTWLGGTTILRRIVAREYDIFGRRPALTGRDFLRMGTWALLPVRFPRADRPRPAATRDAFAYCRRLTRQSGSNFAASFRFLPPRQRDGITAIYAFCRYVDDIVDEPRPRDEKERLLAAWRDEVAACYAGRAQHPILVALAETVRAFGIPRQYLDDLIAGVAMDLTRNRYATFEALHQYCYYVASVVGLTCMKVFGEDSAAGQEYAIHLGIAFQLTNILRDVAADAAQGRIYLPQEDLARCGYTEAELLAGTYNDRFVRLMNHECRRAKDYFTKAAHALPPDVRRRLVVPEIMARIYRALLDEIEQRAFRVFDERIALSRSRKLALAAGVWIRSRWGPPRT